MSDGQPERPTDQRSPRRRRLEPFDGEGRGRRGTSREARRDRRIKWWDRHWGNVAAVVLGALSFALILLLLDLLSGS